MTTNTQLLCTFCTTSNLDITLQKINSAYTVVFDVIYILEDIDHADTLCCTYNIDTNAPMIGSVPDATISLHRKKISNSLYTINALNLLIAELNGGQIDKNFKITWENYQNTILVTAYNKLKIIHTKLNKIIKIHDIA